MEPDYTLIRLAEAIRAFEHFFPTWEFSSKDCNVEKMIIMIQIKRPLLDEELFLLEELYDIYEILTEERTFH